MEECLRMSMSERGDASKLIQMKCYEITLSMTVDAQEYPDDLIVKLEEVLHQQMESSVDVHGRISIEDQRFLLRDLASPECSGGNASSEIPELLTEPPRDS